LRAQNRAISAITLSLLSSFSEELDRANGANTNNGQENRRSQRDFIWSTYYH